MTGHMNEIKVAIIGTVITLITGITLNYMLHKDSIKLQTLQFEHEKDLQLKEHKLNRTQLEHQQVKELLSKSSSSEDLIVMLKFWSALGLISDITADQLDEHIHSKKEVPLEFNDQNGSPVNVNAYLNLPALDVKENSVGELSNRGSDPKSLDSLKEKDEVTVLASKHIPVGGSWKFEAKESWGDRLLELSVAEITFDKEYGMYRVYFDAIKLPSWGVVDKNRRNLRVNGAFDFRYGGSKYRLKLTNATESGAEFQVVRYSN